MKVRIKPYRWTGAIIEKTGLDEFKKKTIGPQAISLRQGD
jgi:hypothetical protein